MTTVPTEEARSLLNLVTIGAVAAATIVVFFGVGFLLLSLPNLATQPVDPAPASEALEAHQAPLPVNNDTPPSVSAALPAHNVAAEPSGVQSDPAAPGSASIAITTAISFIRDANCRKLCTRTTSHFEALILVFVLNIETRFSTSKSQSDAFAKTMICSPRAG
jgi:hypothetical protein